MTPKEPREPKPAKDRPTLAEAAERVALATQVAGAELLEPLRHGELTIFPLETPGRPEPPYILLEDALTAKTAFISEVGASGHVPELLLDNHGERPVLILEGDVLVGAKQNRVVNLTVLAPAHARLALPVSCVERGRWSPGGGGAVELRRSAHLDLRRAKTASVLRSKRAGGRAQSDQLEVWDRVDACLKELAAPSPTDSLEDGFAASAEKLAACREELALPARATGFMVALGGRVLGLDLFDAAQTAARCWGRLGESYLLEALRAGMLDAPGPEPWPPATRQQARAFLRRVALGLRLCPGATGLGREVELTGRGLAGVGLVYEGRLLHLAAFSLDGVAPRSKRRPAHQPEETGPTDHDSADYDPDAPLP